MESESLYADVTGTVGFTPGAEPEGSQARVLVTDTDIVFLFDRSGQLLHQSEPPDIWDAGSREGVFIEQRAVADLADVSQDVPAATAPEETVALVLGFKTGATRENARIEGAAHALRTLQTGVFEAVFDGTVVGVSRSSDDGSVEMDTTRSRLAVGPDRIRFETEHDAFALSRNDIEGFKTVDASDDDRPPEPIVAIYSGEADETVRTTVRLPSVRHVNLFGRYLQTNPDAGTEASSDDVTHSEGTSDEGTPVDQPSSEETVDEQAEQSTDASTTRGESESDTPVEGAPDTSSGPCILIVDDDAGDLEMTEMVLTDREESLEIVTVTSAADGVNALKANSIDCVVSDYDMPVVDGITFLQRVREDYPDLPFILFTGQGSEAVAKQAILSDVTDYVEKGIGTQQYDVLLSRIRKALS